MHELLGAKPCGWHHCLPGVAACFLLALHVTEQQITLLAVLSACNSKCLVRLNGGLLCWITCVCMPA